MARTERDATFPVRLLRVEAAIADAAGFSREQIRGHHRRPDIVLARHAVWLIAVDYLEYSHSYVARLYERDHTTVLSGCARVRGTDTEKIALAGIQKVCADVLTGRHVPASVWSF